MKVYGILKNININSVTNSSLNNKYISVDRYITVENNFKYIREYLEKITIFLNSNVEVIGRNL